MNCSKECPVAFQWPVIAVDLRFRLSMQTLRVDIHQGQSRALGVKGVGQRLADAAGCSGDDRYLSVDAHVAPYRAWMQRS